MKFRHRVALLLSVALALMIATAVVPRIAQDPAYHRFADQRTILGIPHFFDVTSNAPFFFIGAWGVLVALIGSPAMFAEPSERWSYVVLFVGVLLTSFGSSYYHWHPDNQTLVWDRLPMTVGFMGLLSATISERVNHGAGLRLLTPLILLGFASVVYWNRTELTGSGDLRPYILVQFGSLLLLILVLVLFAPKYTDGRYISYAIGCYAMAKLLEMFDAEIYHALRVVSGHTLKHLAAAGAIVWIVWMLKTRKRVSSMAWNRAATTEVVVGNAKTF